MFVRLKSKLGDYKKVINIFKIISIKQDKDGDTEIKIDTGRGTVRDYSHEPLDSFMTRLKQEPKEYEHLTRMSRFELMDL